MCRLRKSSSKKEKAVGVEMKDGEKLYAPNIVSAAIFYLQLIDCFPPDQQEEWVQK